LATSGSTVWRRLTGDWQLWLLVDERRGHAEGPKDVRLDECQGSSDLA
jgi:hypothetical protein